MKVRPIKGTGQYCISHEGKDIAIVTGKDTAYKFAAAPDLLAVLNELAGSAEYWSEYDVPLGIVDRMKAAIAKAEGATPCVISGQK